MDEYEGPKHTDTCKKLRAIAKIFNVKLKFAVLVKSDGDYASWSNLIRVSLDQSKNNLIMTFFHELGHCIDHRRGKYPEYYKPVPVLKIARRVGLRAERSADNTGRLLCKYFFPKIKYLDSYVTKKEVDYHRWYYRDKRKK